MMICKCSRATAPASALSASVRAPMARAPMARAFLACALLAGASAARAADVTYERLLNPEPQNWLMNHHDFGAQRYSPLDRDQHSRTSRTLKLLFAVRARRHLDEREPRGDAAGRGRLHVHGRQLGRRLQDRRALRHRRHDRLEDGSQAGKPGPQPRRRAVGQSGDLGHRLRRARGRDRQGDRPGRVGQEPAPIRPISSSPRRRSPSRTRSWSAARAATAACATGSPRSIPRPAT